MIGVGEEFPYFELQGVDCDNNMGTVSRDDFRKYYKSFFLHQRNFVIVCKYFCVYLGTF